MLLAALLLHNQVKQWKCICNHSVFFRVARLTKADKVFLKVRVLLSLEIPDGQSVVDLQRLRLAAMIADSCGDPQRLTLLVFPPNAIRSGCAAPPSRVHPFNMKLGHPFRKASARTKGASATNIGNTPRHNFAAPRTWDILLPHAGGQWLSPLVICVALVRAELDASIVNVLGGFSTIQTDRIRSLTPSVQQVARHGAVFLRRAVAIWMKLCAATRTLVDIGNSVHESRIHYNSDGVNDHYLPLIKQRTNVTPGLQLA